MVLKCRLTIKGHLSERWADWFGGMMITNLPEGRAEIAGDLVDGAALYGVLDRLRDMGMLTLSLTCHEGTPNDTEANAAAARLEKREP